MRVRRRTPRLLGQRVNLTILETISLIAGRTCVRPCDLNSVPYRQVAGPVARDSAIAAEIALQRAHLEVAPEIGFDSLRRGDGPRKSGVVRHFMQEGSAA